MLHAAALQNQGLKSMTHFVITEKILNLYEHLSEFSSLLDKCYFRCVKPQVRNLSIYRRDHFKPQLSALENKLIKEGSHFVPSTTDV